jgi:hypothetical protein
MKDIKLKAGDIILYKGDSWLSKSIRFFMERDRKKRKLPKRPLFNHAAMVVEYKGQVYVAEANQKGIEVNPFIDAYLKKLNKIKILSPNKPYTKAEKAKVSDVAIADAFNPTRYDFLNFFHQIKMIASTKVKDGKVVKKWKGPKGAKAEKRLYCTEAVATWANDVRPKTFENQFAINPLDIDLSKYYKTIYNGIS